MWYSDLMFKKLVQLDMELLKRLERLSDEGQRELIAKLADKELQKILERRIEKEMLEERIATSPRQQFLSALAYLLPGRLGEEAGGDLAEKISQLKEQGERAWVIWLKVMLCWLPPVVIAILKIKWQELYPSHQIHDD